MTIWLAAALTVAVEAPFLALFGYRTRGDLAVIALVNVITNLTMNLVFSLAPALRGAGGLAAAEILVTVAEYAVYARAFGPGRRLALLTVAANALSLGLGLLLRA